MLAKPILPQEGTTRQMPHASDTAPADNLGVPLPKVEAAVAKFKERVRQSLQAKQDSTELVRQAISRNAPRCPVWLNGFSYDAIVRYGDELADLVCAYPDDLVVIEPYEQTIGHQTNGEKLDPVRLMLQEARWTDEWGIRWGHAAGGMGAHQIDQPIKDWSQLDNYLANHFPDPNAPGRMDAAAALLRDYRNKNYCIGALPLTIKARIFSLRGTENGLMDLVANEAEMRRLADAVCEYSLAMVRRWAEVGVDAVFAMDDWGSQQALLISPALWRSFFKPYYKAVFDEIHKLGMQAFYHSCGNIMQIIPDLIEIGLDVLNPVQPGPLDIQAVAREFGGDICFCGAIDVQHLLPHGTPRQIKDTIRETIEILGQPFGNALILAPANAIGVDTPIANLQALFEACHS
jgi:uroporphyrinogen decarboxylase